MELLSVELAQIAGALGIGAIDVLVILGLTGLIGRLFKNSAVRDVALPVVCILVANAVLWGADLVPEAYEKFATATAFGGAVTGLYPWFGGKLTKLSAALKETATNSKV